MEFGQFGWMKVLVEILAGIGLPLLALTLIWGFRRKRKALERFADPQLLHRLTSSVSKSRQYGKAFLLFLSTSLIVVALARPMWGTKEEQIATKGLDIIIAVDTSLSMDAQDIQPSRIDKAKGEIDELLKLMKGDRIGLIAFAGEAFVQCPLTSDYGAVKIFLDILSTGMIEKPGTDIAAAINLATQTFDKSQRKYKAMVLMTDGEGHTGEVDNAAELASRDGIRIFPIGFGSPSGVPIPVRNDREAVEGYKKDRQGTVVVSKLDEITLEKIALTTGGAYYRASSEEDELNKIYTELQNMEKRELESKLFSHKEDKFQLLLLPAVLLLAIEAILTDRRRKKLKKGERYA